MEAAGITVSVVRRWGREGGKEECVPTWSVWSSGKLHSTVGSRGN